MKSFSLFVDLFPSSRQILLPRVFYKASLLSCYTPSCLHPLLLRCFSSRFILQSLALFHHCDWLLWWSSWKHSLSWWMKWTSLIFPLQRPHISWPNLIGRLRHWWSKLNTYYTLDNNSKNEWFQMFFKLFNLEGFRVKLILKMYFITFAFLYPNCSIWSSTWFINIVLFESVAKYNLFFIPSLS